ncbi:hypothetical protein NHX12_024288, partial [Muraenolepis orangiensis]
GCNIGSKVIPLVSEQNFKVPLYLQAEWTPLRAQRLSVESTQPVFQVFLDGALALRSFGQAYGETKSPNGFFVLALPSGSA